MQPDAVVDGASSHEYSGRGRRSPKPICALFLMAGLALVPIACSTTNSREGDSAHSPHAALELNHGKKWVVAPPMMAHIRKLEKAVQDSEATSSPDHAALAASIQEDLGRLVTNCTMEGKAHDELHKWLMPFLGLSADYSKATDLSVQQEKLREIKQALVVFDRYFE